MPFLQHVIFQSTANTRVQTSVGSGVVPDDEETNDTEGFQSYQEHKIVAREIQKNELQIAKHELIDKKVCKNVISWEITFLGFSCSSVIFIF